jgi:hypothetical protein
VMSLVTLLRYEMGEKSGGKPDAIRGAGSGSDGSIGIGGRPGREGGMRSVREECATLGGLQALVMSLQTFRSQGKAVP